MDTFIIDAKFEIILKLLQQPMHGRGLADALDIPVTTVQIKLQRLVAKEVVDYRTVGKNKIFSLRQNPLARTAVLMAEQYKLLKLYFTSPELQVILEDVRAIGKGMIILFGSYAKFRSKEDSDIDIYIEIVDKKAKERLHQIDSRLSLQTGELSRTDILSREIIMNHIIVRGLEEYYEKFPY